MRSIYAIAASALSVFASAEALASCQGSDLDGDWEWYALYSIPFVDGNDTGDFSVTDYCILEFEDKVIESVRCVGAFTDFPDISEAELDGVNVSFSSSCRLRFSDNSDFCEFAATVSPEGLTASGVGQCVDFTRLQFNMVKRP